MNRYLLTTAAMVLSAALWWAPTAKAASMTGPFCKTAEALEEGYQYFSEHKDATVPEVLSYVNGKDGPYTCSFGTVTGERKEDIKTSELGMKHTISRIAVAGESVEVYMAFNDSMDPVAPKASTGPSPSTHYTDLCEGRSISSYDEWNHVRSFWCS